MFIKNDPMNATAVPFDKSSPMDMSLLRDNLIKVIEAAMLPIAVAVIFWVMSVNKVATETITKEHNKTNKILLILPSNKV
ncbi:MAG: hypothetical protein QXG40_04710 [Ignisphaera sp.]